MGDFNLAASQWARIGLCIAPKDPYGPYFEEALLHAGLGTKPIPRLDSGELQDLEALVLCGYGELQAGARDAVAEWVARGGAIVCCGSTWGLNDLLGLQSEPIHASNEIAWPKSADRLWPDGAPFARFYGGTIYYPHGCETVAATESGKTVLGRHRAGRGLALIVAPHVGQTTALMQMGRSVETDSIGPGDGSAILDDGKLRAEDGTNLFYEGDRSRGEAGSTPFFAYPHADVVREMLIRAVLEAVNHSGKRTTVVWQWPRMANAAALLTLDCEDFNPEHVFRTHQLLSMHGCPASWLVGVPGYPLDVYRSIRAWDHEVGCLFAAESDASWSDERLKLQHVSLVRAASVHNAFAARAQDGQWRGWHQFYEMCEIAGARLSVSKGGRQGGTVGFLFGTSHPFFPRRADGSEYLVAELPYTVYMPGQVTADAVCDSLFETTLARGGCFHMVCRPEATASPVVSSSIRRLLTNCRHRRVEFMLPERLWRFEKGRRNLRRVYNGSSADSQVILISDAPLEGLTLMISGPPVSVEVRGRLAQVRPIERYGTQFTAVLVDLEPKQHAEIRLGSVSQKAAA